MKTSPTQTKFIGTWEMDASASNFEFDNPPKAAKLKVAHDKEGLLFDFEWQDSELKTGRFEQVIRIGKPTLANGLLVTLTAPNANTLNTTTEKDGMVQAVTTRELAKDGRSFVSTQVGKAGDRAFKNVSTYRKI